MGRKEAAAMTKFCLVRVAL